MYKCEECKETFKDRDAFSEHLRTHNPSPAQWTDAHNRITESMSAAKKQAKAAERAAKVNQSPFSGR